MGHGRGRSNAAIPPRKVPPRPISHDSIPHIACRLGWSGGVTGGVNGGLSSPRASPSPYRAQRHPSYCLQEYSWVADLLCKPGATPAERGAWFAQYPAKREACAAAEVQWRSYEAEQGTAGGGWAARAPVIEVTFHHNRVPL